MSKFTTQVRYVCESFAGLEESVGGDKINEVLTPEVMRRIFGEYPIFSEGYRNTLESNILRYYYTCEIGFETVGMWRLALNTKMRLIMPKYNELYKKQALLFNIDIFNDTDYIESKNGTDTLKRGGTDNTSHTGTVNDKGTSNTDSGGSNSGTSRRLYSDTPQSAVDFPIESETSVGQSFMSDLTKNIGEEHFNVHSTTGADNTRTYGNSDNRTVDMNDTTTYNNQVQVKGKRGITTYAKMFAEFTDNIHNIDMMICEELNTLFMGLWE